MGLDDRPLVSVCCTTYNHEKYIQETIEAFLSQKTKFPVEIIIHDDASTDRTAEIVKAYAEEHLDIIIAILQSENKYSQGINPWSTFVFPRARGKYIAICEGDDYWIDPFKLQKQVDFLEQNPGYGLVHGNCHCYYQENGQWMYNANDDLINKDNLSSEQLFKSLVDGVYKIRTATVLFEKELLKKRTPDTEKFEMGDTPMWLDFSQITKFKYLEEVFSVYRVLPDSASRSTNRKKHYRFILSMYEMRLYYSKKHGYILDDKIKNCYNISLLNYKVFDPKYNERSPLLDPTRNQKLCFEVLNFPVFKRFFLNNYFFQEIVNRFLIRFLQNRSG